MCISFLIETDIIEYIFSEIISLVCTIIMFISIFQETPFAIIVLSGSSKPRRKSMNAFLIHQTFIDFNVCMLTIIPDEIIAKKVAWLIHVCVIIYQHVLQWKECSISTYNIMSLSIARNYTITTPIILRREGLERLPYVLRLRLIDGYVIQNGYLVPLELMADDQTMRLTIMQCLINIVDFIVSYFP